MDNKDWLFQVEGAALLFEWFQSWPTFHDAEIIEICLRRKKDSWVKVRTNEGSMLIGTEYRSPDDLIVTFKFGTINDLELFGFSQQNVVDSIELEKVGDDINIKLCDCYGIAGTISAKQLSFDIRTVSGTLDE